MGGVMNWLAVWFGAITVATVLNTVTVLMIVLEGSS